MNIDKIICERLCHEFKSRKIPIGYVITTPFKWIDGGPLVFYIRKNGNKIRFEDSGDLFIQLEDYCGDLSTSSRMDAVRFLSSGSNVMFDEDDSLFYTEWVNEDDFSEGFVSILSFLNRIQDLQLITTAKVENTFKEDLMIKLENHFSKKYSVKRSIYLSEDLKEYIVDMLISDNFGNSIAIYAATNEIKALEALVAANMISEKKLLTTPFLIYENYIKNPISTRTKTRTMNHLTLKVKDYAGEIFPSLEAPLRAA